MGITKGRKIRSGINTLFRDDTTEMVSSIKKMVIKLFCRMGWRGIRTVDLLVGQMTKFLPKSMGLLMDFVC